MTDRDLLEMIVLKLDKMDKRIDRLEEQVDEMKSNMNQFKKDLSYNTLVVENTVNQCIKVLGEGFQMNAERLDRSDIDTIKYNSEFAMTAAKTVNERINKLERELKKSA